MHRIEFGELVIGDVARKNLMHVCDTNWASGGPKVKELEKRWSKIFDYKRSVAMSSGTDAVIASCLALYDIADAKRGDEVIVPALSFIATSNAVRGVFGTGYTPSTSNSLDYITMATLEKRNS